MPCYACFGLLIGLGAWALIRHWRWTRWAGVVLATVPVGLYAVLPHVARRLEFNPFTRSLPYRDPYELFLKPWWNGDDGVRRYVEDAFGVLPKNAVLFGDPTPIGALLYAQRVEGLRPDVRFFWVWEQLPLEKLLVPTFPPRWERPVYTVSNDKRYAPEVFIRDCQPIPDGALYRIVPLRHFPKTPWR